MTPAPVIVFDSNPDALRWRSSRTADIAGPGRVLATTSLSAVMLIAERLPDASVVLVDLLATDRLALDRPGERLIRSLLRNPRTSHVHPVAWSAHTAPDVIDGVRRAGAMGFVQAGADEARERKHLRMALEGEFPWPEVPGVESDATGELSRWFIREFGVEWEPWIEPALCKLTSGRDRKALAIELLNIGAAGSPGHAATRMRKLARLVAGEHRNSPAAVAAAAQTVLTRIAAHRPLADRPPVSISLELSARLVRTAASLVRAAGLTDDDVAQILEMDALIRTWRDRRPAKRGAPTADEVSEERHWAAGRRALDHEVDASNVDEIINGLLLRLDEVLVALDDARQDELYHPEARAAAALRLIEEQQVVRVPDDVTLVDSAATWRGMTAGVLALSGDTPVDALQALVATVDELAVPPRLAR